MRPPYSETAPQRSTATLVPVGGKRSCPALSVPALENALVRERRESTRASRSRSWKHASRPKGRTPRTPVPSSTPSGRIQGCRGTLRAATEHRRGPGARHRPTTGPAPPGGTQQRPFTATPGPRKLPILRGREEHSYLSGTTSLAALSFPYSIGSSQTPAPPDQSGLPSAELISPPHSGGQRQYSRVADTGRDLAHRIPGAPKAGSVPRPSVSELPVPFFYAEKDRTHLKPTARRGFSAAPHEADSREPCRSITSRSSKGPRWNTDQPHQHPDVTLTWFARVHSIPKPHKQNQTDAETKGSGRLPHR